MTAADLAGLRVLVLTSTWPPSAFLRRLFDRLTAAGADLTVASPDPVPAPLHWIPVASGHAVPPLVLARHAASSVAAAARRTGVGAALRSAAPLLGGTDRFRPVERLPFARGGWDVTYVPWVLSAADYLPLLDLLPPIVASCRGSQVTVAPWNPDRAGQLAGLADVFDRARLVHCVSAAIVEDAVALGMDRGKARVVRPGADTTVFTPPPGSVAGERPDRRAGRLRLVAVGNLSWVKGFAYLVSAVARLVADGVDVSLDVVGEGRERTRLAAAARDVGVADRVRLVGSESPRAVRDRLWAADAYVLSSVSEGISNAALEAMATGLPLVTTDCGGMAEVVDDGVEGFVVPVRDPAAMAAALGLLAADPVGADRMGVAARDRIAADGLTADANAAGLAALLAEVGRGRAGSAA